MLSRVIIGLAALATPAFAQDHQHHHPTETITGATAKFYETWMRPDQPYVSCCNKEDCYPTEASFRNGRWYALQRETGEWVVIPPEKIEHERDSPDGLNHVCMSKVGHVFCFKAGGGT